MVETRQNKR
jgi:ribosome assembly protein 4